MEMNQEMKSKYGEENVQRFESYSKNYLQDMKTPETLDDLKIGTILTQHWCNSCDYFIVVHKTKKTVSILHMPDIQVSFDHDGGGTGTRYHMPDFKTYNKLRAESEEAKQIFGKDPLSMKAAEYEKLSKDDKKRWIYDRYNHSEYLNPTKKVVKFLDKGGFYIPGFHTGSWCGPMRIWNGSVCSDYYGD